MANEALKLWQIVPSDIRRMLLSNVWCGECRKSVTIVDYHAELNGVVVLQGFCGTCGHKVARVIDDLAQSPKKKVKATESGLYIFNVWLYGDEHCTQAFKDIGEKMIFLFDYGDGWQFNVELLEIGKNNKGDLKPKVLESIGEAPLQYPPCEE